MLLLLLLLLLLHVCCGAEMQQHVCILDSFECAAEVVRHTGNRAQCRGAGSHRQLEDAKFDLVRHAPRALGRAASHGGFSHDPQMPRDLQSEHAEFMLQQHLKASVLDFERKRI